MSRIAVLGAGAWGTAIALSLSRRGGHNITLWSHSVEEARQISDARENILFLPGFPLPADLTIWEGCQPQATLRPSAVSPSAPKSLCSAISRVSQKVPSRLPRMAMLFA